MHYTSNVFEADAQHAYNCAYAALQSVIPKKPVTATPYFLTLHSEYGFAYPIIVTIEPLERNRCRFHMDGGMVNGTSVYTVRILNDFLQAFAQILTQPGQ